MFNSEKKSVLLFAAQGMSSLFWTNDKKTFVDDAGMRMKVSDIIKTFRQNDVDVNVLATPRVKAFVQRHFGCSELQGAELEDDLGRGTAGSHWEQRIYEGEMMDGVTGVNLLTARHMLTELTCSLLEDTGWYAENANSHYIVLGILYVDPINVFLYEIKRPYIQSEQRAHY